MAISPGTAEVLKGTLEALRDERVKYQAKHDELTAEAEAISLGLVEIDATIASIEHDMAAP